MVTVAMKLKALAPWKKSYDQHRQHIKKHYFTLLYFTLHLHYIALPANVCLVIFFSSMFFSSSHVCQGVLDYKKKAGHQRMDAFELWCWRRLLRVPWTARRSNQSILKEIIPEYSLKGLMLKLQLQYFVHVM